MIIINKQLQFIIEIILQNAWNENKFKLYVSTSNNVEN